MKLVMLFFLLPIVLFGQESKKDSWEFSVKGKSGFLAAHRGTMGHLAKDRLLAGEFSFYKRVRSKSWSSDYRNPYVGITLYGSNLGNRDILGYGFGGYGFVEFPWTRSEKFVLTSKVGAGLGIITKVYNKDSNPKNVPMSSYVNALICLGVQGKWYVKPNHGLMLSLDMTHFSNGASKVPNLGVNMMFVGLGYSYTVANKEPKVVDARTFQHVPFFKSWNVSLVGILSEKQIFPTGGKRYPVFALSGMLYKQFKPKVGMEIALDVISKQSIFNYREYIPKTQGSIIQVGAYLGYNVPLDRFRFVLGMGAYLRDRYDQDGRFYHRVGMRYQCENGLLFNLVLKSNWAKADYVEYGVGYTFNYKARYHAK
ncbi:hypothetical protein Fluta_2754 [Fluviicola taffensis DSM 16823]|uniref:Lipid A 3-O-deacylase-related protein n=2 Tax=Fluviicola TaxID=332102 RepID=F2IGV3_FLUTR|nr:hypothetical protein Fluta_2754 [Fluviicola taffensis DSM 16823]